jgi:hypothetical protein
MRLRADRTRRSSKGSDFQLGGLANARNEAATAASFHSRAPACPERERSPNGRTKRPSARATASSVTARLDEEGQLQDRLSTRNSRGRATHPSPVGDLGDGEIEGPFARPPSILFRQRLTHLRAEEFTLEHPCPHRVQPRILEKGEDLVGEFPLRGEEAGGVLRSRRRSRTFSSITGPLTEPSSSRRFR